MARRLELDSILRTVLGSSNVYFQPPSNLQMKYPCIVYERDNTWDEYANNKLYAHMKRYQVTVIDRNPDSEIPEVLKTLTYCGFLRHFTADNLNHDVYQLYY